MGTETVADGDVSLARKSFMDPRGWRHVALSALMIVPPAIRPELLVGETGERYIFLCGIAGGLYGVKQLIKAKPPDPEPR